MDGGRAEAERWLTAAEKLLTNRDFHGCKSFAIRARETDPRLEATDRLLAVVDTLIAGECLINSQQPDWYGILQLGHLTHSVDLIADHYRRLALLLNPERNPFLFSDQAFRLVSEAWSVLSNPDKKAYYDNELRMIQFGHIGFQQPPPKEGEDEEDNVCLGWAYTMPLRFDEKPNNTKPVRFYLTKEYGNLIPIFGTNEVLISYNMLLFMKMR